ncbi:MAG: hypothetical protein WD011_01965 [Nitriliruptoraceae bacterium]
MVDQVRLIDQPVQRIDVTGADRAAFLEDVTTQHYGDAGVGDVRGALVLDPHGLPQAMFDVVVLGDRFALLAADDEQAAWIVDTLGGRTFLRDAAFARVASRTIAVRGTNSDRVLADVGLGVVPGRARLADGVLLIPRADGVDVVARDADAGEIRNALVAAGVEPTPSAGIDDWRVVQGIPAWGREVVAPHLPEEAGVLPTHVHLAKGCYPGQEAVARMWMLGRPRRRLARITARAAALHPGQELGEGRDAVTVTTVHADGQRALAFVPADATAGTSITRSEITLDVDALVGVDAPPGHEPSVTRRRDRPVTTSR